MQRITFELLCSLLCVVSYQHVYRLSLKKAKDREEKIGQADENGSQGMEAELLAGTNVEAVEVSVVVVLRCCC